MSRQGYYMNEIYLKLYILSVPLLAIVVWIAINSWVKETKSEIGENRKCSLRYRKIISVIILISLIVIAHLQLVDKYTRRIELILSILFLLYIGLLCYLKIYWRMKRK